METRVESSLPPVDLRWEVVQRVSSSTSFQRSPRLRELFAYICDRSLQNHTHDLREQAIGCAVFGRKADYNPGEDNIVRVEMRQLRKRLEDYFANEGKDEPFVILIPKGAYVPVFEPRESAATRVAQSEPAVAVPLRPANWRRWAVLSACIALALAGVSLWLWSQVQRLEQRANIAAPRAERPQLWPLLFNNDQETLVVCADSSLVVAQSLLNRSLSLDEYVSRDFGKATNLSSESRSLLHSIPNWQFTDITDVRLVQRLYRLNADYWDKVAIRSAKSMQIQDFKNGNSVLLGSIRSNIWNKLFEPMLNFRFDYDTQNRAAFIRNQHPRPGEQDVYRAAGPGRSGDSYSILALVPNLRHTGHVLIIAGTTGEGTEAAGELIMNPATSSALLNSLMQRNKGKLPYFEALLRSSTLSGVAKNAETIAIRIVSDEPSKQ
jgi:hypothetical protein